MVMLIIGLLVGGVLKGNEIVMNGQITATVTQIRAYDTATIAFTDLYDDIPGTMRSPGAKLLGCASLPACLPTGVPNNEHLDNGFDIAPDIGHERVAFFIHLAKADFIGGIDESAGMVFSGYFPEAEIKGAGFHVAYAVGGVQPDELPGLISEKHVNTAHYFAIHSSNTAATEITVVDSPVLTPNMASRIDVKLDDGSAVTGRVLAFGESADGDDQCARTNGVYTEANTDLTCGLYVRTPR